MQNLFLGYSRLGKAVFASKFFKKDEPIIEFSGPKMKRNELPELITPEDDRYVQIGKNVYLGPSGNLDDFINHSCDPNSGLKIENNGVFLMALNDIFNGEEITWDYSTTMDEDEWEMDCMCGSKNCRRRIRDFKYLPEDIQKKYIDLGIVPFYVIQNIS